MKTQEIKVSGLFIYPLKSAAPVSLKKMDIVPTGPQWDRQWMLITETGGFVSQRTHPNMCMINQQVTETTLVVDAPGMTPLTIPLDPPQDPELKPAKLFQNQLNSHWLGVEFDQWFSQYLQQSVQLVRAPGCRKTTAKYDPQETPLLFPDGFSFLLTNSSTLDELNSKLPEPILMNRFRPNIVIIGADANQEDQWPSIQIGEIKFDCVKACSRCVVITRDQDTGESNSEVMKTLSSYRKKDGKVVFGQNLVHRQLGSIKINDKIVIL